MIDFLRSTLTSHGYVWSVNFDRGGLVASGLSDRTIKLWNVTTGECIRTLIGHEGRVFSVSFDQKGLLASGSADGTIKL